MPVNIPPKVRFALYVVSALGSVVAAYLFARGIVGEAETGLWAGVVAIINTISASNVSSQRILGKAVVSPTSPRKTEQGRADVVTLLVVVILVVLLLAILGVL